MTTHRCFFFQSGISVIAIITLLWLESEVVPRLRRIVFSGFSCSLPFVLVSFLYFAEMSQMPKFRRHREGFLILEYTREADEVFKESNDNQSVTSKPLEEEI